MNERTKKYLSITSSAILALSLTACSAPQSVANHTNIQNQSTTKNQTPEEYAKHQLASELKPVENSKYANACANWERRSDGSYYCGDPNSKYHGNYFFNGVLFGTLGAMTASSLYKTNNLINGTRLQEIAKTYKKDKEDSNSAASSYSSNSNSNSKNSIVNGSSKESSKSSTSKSNSSSSKSSSVSGGKTGFGSGGAKFGGSSAS